MLWMIDNYDSFTFNLVQYLGEIGQPVQVVKNDELTVAELLARHVAGIVISPGPGNPNDSGISLEVIRAFAPSKPILGVCLGHQAIGQVFGARVVHARKVMHGKTCDIYHDGTGIFRDLPSPLKVTRYHSLVIDPASLPEDLQVTAYTRTADGTPDEIMAIRHVRHRIEGVQFHPEAILTEHGHSLLRNFCAQLGA